MNGKVASSKALGFGVFAIGAWLFCMNLAGFMSVAYGTPLRAVAMIAMLGLLVAAIAAFLRGEVWLAFFFMLWSAVSWGTGGGAMSGWLWLALALVNLYLWMAARRGAQETAVAAVAFLVGIAALGEGLRGVAGLNLAGQIGSYFGLASAAFAFYVSAASIMCPEGCNLPGLSSKGSGGV